MVSLKDIATEVGVSVSLVSKVLNDRMGTTGASEQLMEKIRDKAKEMGYRKNLSAVALQQGRQNVLGLFIHQIGASGSGIAESFLMGAAAEAAAHQQKLFLNFFSTDEEFRKFREEIHRGMVDGIILSGLSHPDLHDDLLEIEKSGVPVVTNISRGADPSLVNVAVDQAEVGEIATKHLLDRGCQCIVHIQNQEERTEGYRKALKDFRITPSDEWIYPSGESAFTYSEGCKAAKKFMETGIDFDGVVCQSDQQAMGVLNTLLEAGKKVPDDVRVIGVDNAPFCTFTPVPLSSVSQSMDEQGRLAIKMLMERVAGRTISSLQVNPQVHDRASTQ